MIDHELEYRFNTLLESSLEEEGMEELMEEVLDEVDGEYACGGYVSHLDYDRKQSIETRNDWC